MGMDRRDNSRGMGTDRDGQVGRVKLAFVPWLVSDRLTYSRRLIFYHLILVLQHFSDRGDRHGRDNWSGGYDKRMNPR